MRERRKTQYLERYSFTSSVPTNFAKSPSRQADKPLLTKTRRFTSDEDFDLTGSGYLYVLSTFSYLVAALCLEGRGTSYVGWNELVRL